MRQTVGRIIVILVCTAVLGGFIYIDNESNNHVSGPVLSFYLGDEIINAWKGEDKYYLFLPSYAETADAVITPYSMEFEVVGEELMLLEGTSLSKLDLDKTFSCRNIENGEKFSFCIMKSENLPTLFMETDSGSIDAVYSDKEIEENGKMILFSKDGEKLFAGGLESIKTRGNYSFDNYEKKPFSITAKESVSLLGLGEGQKYVLLSNASDPTLLRNDIARKMDAVLDAEYDNVGRYLDLYINGDYFGNYYLCEKIEIGYDRINVTNLEEQMDRLYRESNYESYELYETDTKRARYLDENPADITGGYLVEREFEDRYKLEYLENPSSFITSHKEHFVVKSPVYCSVEQIDYLESFFNEAETAVLAEDGIHPVTKKSYEEYIDVDSFVKKYLVEEVTKNYDGGVSSVYFYKDSDSIDGRIKAAPVWDCDMSLGNYLDWMEYFYEDPTGISRLASHTHASPWYESLYEKEEYYQKVCRYYKEALSPYMQQLTDNLIDEQESLLRASAGMDEIRWAADFNNNPYYVSRDKSYEDLKEFVKIRKAYLDSIWINE